MATTIATGSGLKFGSIVSLLTAPFRALGNGLMMLAENNIRAKQVEELMAKSDAELQAMGLKREDIARYVFKDMLHI